MLARAALLVALGAALVAADDFQDIPIVPGDFMIYQANSIPKVPGAKAPQRLLMTHFGGPFEVDPNNNQKDPLNTAIGGLFGAQCGMGPMERYKYPFWHAAAFNSKEADSPIAGLRNKGCGSCWRVTCNDPNQCTTDIKSAIVVITDVCDGCKDGIDVNYNTATTISSTLKNWNSFVNVERVMCPVPGNVRLSIHKWSESEISAAPIDVAGQGIVTEMYAICGDGAWRWMNLDWGAVFKTTNVTAETTSCRFRLTREGTSKPIWSVPITRPTAACGQYTPCVVDTGVQFVDDQPEPVDVPQVLAAQVLPPNGCPACVDVVYPNTTLGCITLERKGDGERCDLPEITTPTKEAPWGYCARRCGRCPDNC